MTYTHYDKYIAGSTVPEKSIENGKATYYAKFGWKKSYQFEINQAWNTYLTRFAQYLKNPLVVAITQP